MRVEGQAVSQDVVPVMIGSKSTKNVEQQPEKTVESKAPDKSKAAGKSKVPTNQELQGAVDFANKAMKMSNYHLKFVMPEKGSQVQVKVIDSDSGETIREIPSDFMMNIAEQLQSNIDKACGITVDELA
jgi:flagellar protein FlaG